MRFGDIDVNKFDLDVMYSMSSRLNNTEPVTYECPNTKNCDPPDPCPTGSSGVTGIIIKG